MTSCSRTMEVPREQFEAAASEKGVAHCITTGGGEEYLVTRFSVVDTTLIIEQLRPDDTRHHEVALPITLPINDVETIARIESRSHPVI
jgi:hypothetical protein